jgi:uncharacterized membrane protein YuzA (DUF378 family)
LIVIGGLNWALVGIGIFADKNLNVVNLIFGNVGANVAWLEAVIYILVGLAAVSLLFGGCRCKKCRGSACKNCDASGVCTCTGCGDKNCCCGGKEKMGE